MTNKEIKNYEEYAKNAMSLFIGDYDDDDERLKKMCEVINQYYEDTLKDIQCGWLIQNAEDAKRFLSESSYVNDVLEGTDAGCSLNELVGNFVFYEDRYSAKKRGWVFATEEEVKSILIREASGIFQCVVNHPTIYPTELYPYAIEPFVARARFGGMNMEVYRDDLCRLWKDISEE